MKFIKTRKFTWIICIIGFLLALERVSKKQLYDGVSVLLVNSDKARKQMYYSVLV